MYLVFEFKSRGFEKYYIMNKAQSEQREGRPDDKGKQTEKADKKESFRSFIQKNKVSVPV